MAVYLRRFSFLTGDDEASFVLSYPHQLEMRCFGDSVYPFKLLPERGIERLEFENITLLCGENGSGKSTCLNIIAEKLGLERSAPFNRTPFFEDYLKRCEYTLQDDVAAISGKALSSDDVFAALLKNRSYNERVAAEREACFRRYDDINKTGFRMNGLDELEELKIRNEARRKTKSAFASSRVAKEIAADSNGETALSFFANSIGDGKLYLLDEPENSLSPQNQLKLAGFIADSARFFDCQFIISTHSPFFLALAGAKIYDLDGRCRTVSSWTELESMKIYSDFFAAHSAEFSRQYDQR